MRVLLATVLSTLMLFTAAVLSHVAAGQTQSATSMKLSSSVDIRVDQSRKLTFPKGLSNGTIAENSRGNRVLPPLHPAQVFKRYWYGFFWVNADFNRDGLSDYLYTGTMRTTGPCNGTSCPGKMYGPTLYLGQRNGTYKDFSDLFVDNRKQPGQSMARQNLVSDFNGDGTLDLYIADTGFYCNECGDNNGFRDSYFLSQSNGTWLESSETHLSDPTLVTFDHAAATGDIDNDGDEDVVITGPSLYCLMNDGKGYLTKRICGHISAFGMELGDVDGDGDLDILHAAHEFEPYFTHTGVTLNDGSGEFQVEVPLPQIERWGTVPEVAFWDLDNDGDLDAVLSRAGKLYVGVAVQVLENLGNLSFRSKLYRLVVAPRDFIAEGEGNDWNAYVQHLRFGDVDKDGDFDIVLVSDAEGPQAYKVVGSILRNEGLMQFKHIQARQNGNPVKMLSENLFIGDSYK